MRRMVITGGFGALGAGLAKAALAQGYKLALIDRAPAPAGLDPSVVALGEVDLSDAGQAGRAFAEASEKLGGLDVLVNVAGAFSWETIADGAIETWDRLYQINVRSAVVATRAALPFLLDSDTGRIVNIGANAAGKAAMGMGAYAASKAGVAKLTEALSDELKSKGVTVNAVLPSIIDTAANRADMPDADHSAWVTPAELAAVILFLASVEAGAVTGALVPVVGRV